MGPIYPKHVHGGSQKILREISIALGEIGWHIEILTPYNGSYSKYHLRENVIVNPLLGYKPSYPEPHYTAPYRLSATINTIGNKLQDFDLFYIHDSELSYSFLNDEIKSVSSFRDFVYPDTLSAGMNFRRDHLIVNSEYTYNSVLETMGTYLSGLKSRMTLVENGIDRSHFHKIKKPSISNQILPIKSTDFNILYPHRPDSKKGIWQALEAVKLFVEKLSKNEREKVKLFVPEWIDKGSEVDSEHEYNTIYEEILKRSEDLGIGDNVITHPWISYDNLPTYYSLGNATLSIGSFVESFGSNSSIESLFCGTPVIFSKSGCQRDLLPDNDFFKVDFGDDNAVAKYLFKIYSNSINDFVINSSIFERFDFKRMISGYKEVFEKCERSSPLSLKYQKIKPNSKFKIANWCYINNQKEFYNDYLGCSIKEPELLNIVSRHQVITTGDLISNIKTHKTSPNFHPIFSEDCLAKYSISELKTVLYYLQKGLITIVND